MNSVIRPRIWLPTSVFCLLASLAARAEEPTAKPAPKPAPIPGVSLLDALQAGAVAVDTEGTGDGRMAITVANQTSRKLRVILPPGLVASGATGQFGGMGGMGGGGMGGSMGGGMGGGGGMMGGMGGGFRSVPPTDLPDATLKPGQTRRLLTRVVSLNPPATDGGVLMPQAGEKLVIGDITQISIDPRIRKALCRLAADKAPETVAQLVLWNVAGRLDWGLIAQASGGWANPQELALARQFVERLDSLPEGESGQLFVEVAALEAGHEALAGEMSQLLGTRLILGLRAASGVPSKPSGPSVGCKVQLVGEGGHPEALVRVAESDGHREWKTMGKFSLPVPLDSAGKPDMAAFGDKLAEGILTRLVRVKLIKGRKSLEGLTTYTVQVDNASPLILNGVSMIGSLAKPSEPPRYLLGVALPPQRSLQFPISPGTVEANGLKKGLHLVGLDLSAL